MGLVDEIASHVVGQVLLDHRDDATPVMDAWAVTDATSGADSMGVRRTAMLAQLRHGEETDTSLLERVLVAHLDGTAYSREFFLPLGARLGAWAARTH